MDPSGSVGPPHKRRPRSPRSRSPIPSRSSRPTHSIPRSARRTSSATAEDSSEETVSRSMCTSSAARTSSASRRARPKVRRRTRLHPGDAMLTARAVFAVFKTRPGASPASETEPTVQRMRAIIEDGATLFLFPAPVTCASSGSPGRPADPSRLVGASPTHGTLRPKTSSSLATMPA